VFIPHISNLDCLPTSFKGEWWCWTWWNCPSLELQDLYWFGSFQFKASRNCLPCSPEISFTRLASTILFLYFPLLEFHLSCLCRFSAQWEIYLTLIFAWAALLSFQPSGLFFFFFFFDFWFLIFDFCLDRSFKFST